MAFEEITPTAATSARSRYSGEGFRQEPDFREGTTTFQAAAQPAATVATTDSEPTVTIARRSAPPNLTYVFDDPAHGEPGHDRFLVHGLWELLLAVAVGVVGFLLYREQSDAFAGDGLRGLLHLTAVFGLLAAGSAVALRAGAVNLAVGPVALAAAFYFSAHSGGGLLQPLLVVVAVAAAVGVAQAVVMAGLHVPPWAAGLAAAMGVLIWIGGQSVATGAEVYSALPQVYWWFGGFCAFSVVASVVGLFPSVRRTFGRFRSVTDPADRRGWAAGLITVAATAVSSVLAGLSGVLAAADPSFSTSIVGPSAATIGPSAGGQAMLLTAIGIGVALVGGTSAFGRRGGLFGTVLAAGLFVLLGGYTVAAGLTWSTASMALGALVIGLLVTRMIERFGRPAPAEADQEEEDEGWLLRSHAATESTGSWPAAKPYQPTTSQTTTGGLWASDEAWGTADRR